MSNERLNADYLWEKFYRRVSGPSNSYDHIMIALEYWDELEGLFWFDDEKNKIMTRSVDGKECEWDEIDEASLTLKLERGLYFIKLSQEKVSTMVKLYIRNQMEEFVEKPL